MRRPTQMTPVRPTPTKGSNRMAQDVARGLKATPKVLSSRYFYDAVGSKLFETITELPEYYLTRAESEILRRRAGDILRRSRPEFLVELGAGSAQKTRILLDAARSNGSGPLRGFIPFDISEASLQQVARDLIAAYPGLAVLPLAGDFAIDLSEIPRLGRQLVLFLGSTIGNFDDQEGLALLSRVHSLLAPEDAFLIGFDLVKDEAQLVAAYDDAQGVTACFNLNLLARLNRELGADFDLVAFSHVAIYNREERQMEIYLRSEKDQLVTIPRAWLRVSFQREELMRTEISRKFERSRAESLLEAASMRLTDWYTDSGTRFALALATSRAG